jgi:acetoin utilization deacetylase AcuC-like enzyme
MNAGNPRIDVFWHEDVLLHDIGPAAFDSPPNPLLAVDERHIEGPDRIRNMLSVLERGPIAPYLEWHEGREAALDEILTFHEQAYIESLEAMTAAGGKEITRTTHLTANSMRPIRLAAGMALAAMGHVLDGKGAIAYALVRPPGHHAAPAMADGYCFVNNAALAAELAIRRGCQRVAIIDWDVHHGNGTQEGFYERDAVLTVSSHMDHRSWDPVAHPQLGTADEVGRGAGLGLNINVPLPMGTGDEGYDRAMREIVKPAIDDFAPEMIVVANGQDANQFAPMGASSLPWPVSGGWANMRAPSPTPIATAGWS